MTANHITKSGLAAAPLIGSATGCIRDRFAILLVSGLLGSILTSLVGNQSLAEGTNFSEESRNSAFPHAQASEPGQASEDIIQSGSSQAIRAPEQVDLVGVAWQWVRTVENSGKVLAPFNPADYTLQFIGDDRVSIRADCNSGEGTYEVEGQILSITVTHTTLAACSSDSMEQPYLRDLQAAAIYFFQDEDLYLDLNFDTGIMKFTRD